MKKLLKSQFIVNSLGRFISFPYLCSEITIYCELLEQREQNDACISYAES